MDSPLDRVIDELYQCALGSLAPESLLSSACSLLGFRSGTSFGILHTPHSVTHAVSWVADAEASREARSPCEAGAIHSRSGWEDLDTGELRFLDAPPRHGDTHDPMPPHGQDYRVQICLEACADWRVVIELARPSGLVDRDSQRALLDRLLPHWLRAHTVFMRLDYAESLRRAYRDSANIGRHAIVILDDAGNRIVSNDAAEALLPADGISLTPTGIRATLEPENQRLQRALRQITTTTHRPQDRPNSMDLQISRSDGRLPLQMMLVPLLAGYPRVGKKPAAMLIIFDPESPIEVAQDRCMSLFGFTRAEAQVAMGIVQGRSVEQLAAEQHRHVSTTRNLLKRVFQKAGVSRQGELVSLMLNSPLLFQFQEETLAGGDTQTEPDKD